MLTVVPPSAVARSQPLFLLKLASMLVGTSTSHLVKVAMRLIATYTACGLAFGSFYLYPWQLPGVVARVTYTMVVTLCEYAARGFKPLFPEWTLRFELIRAVIRALTSNYADRLLHPSTAEYNRQQTAVIGTVAGFFLKRQLGVVTKNLIYKDLEHVWVRSAQKMPSNARRVVMLYFHGGGYGVLSPRLYIPLACELQSRMHKKLNTSTSQAIQVDILLANYRKIPENPYPIPVLDAVEMYKYLLEQEKLSPDQIIIGGDSAGAGLTMATMIRVRESQPELLPLGAVLSCPFVDLEHLNDQRKVPHCILGDITVQAVFDGYHSREGDPSTWGDASPVHCDLRGLPPVYIQAAELDYVLPHAQRLMQKAVSDGVTNWTMEIFPNVPHAFVSFPSSILPSSAKGHDAMAEFMVDRFSKTLEASPTFA